MDSFLRSAARPGSILVLAVLLLLPDRTTAEDWSLDDPVLVTRFARDYFALDERSLQILVVDGRFHLVVPRRGVEFDGWELWREDAPRSWALVSRFPGWVSCRAFLLDGGIGVLGVEGSGRAVAFQRVRLEDGTIVERELARVEADSIRPASVLADGERIDAILAVERPGAERGFDLLHVGSIDGGTTWSGPVSLGLAGEDAQIHRAVAPMTRRSAGALVVFSNDPERRIIENESVDGGRTWTARPITPEDGFADTVGRFPVACFERDGELHLLHLIWMPNDRGQYQLSVRDGRGGYGNGRTISPRDRVYNRSRHVLLLRTPGAWFVLGQLGWNGNGDIPRVFTSDASGSPWREIDSEKATGGSIGCMALGYDDSSGRVLIAVLQRESSRTEPTYISIHEVLRAGSLPLDDSDPGRSMDELIRGLGAEDWHARVESERLLRRSGRHAAEPLWNAAASMDLDVRRRAAAILADQYPSCLRFPRMERRWASRRLAEAVRDAGPRRAGESESECDARNRRAIAFFLDGIAVDPDLQTPGAIVGADRHLAPPIWTAPAFRQSGCITARDWTVLGGRPALVTGDDSGAIRILDPEEGSSRLVTLALAPWSVRLIRASGGRALAASDADVFALDLDDRRILWRRRFERPSSRDPDAREALYPIALGLIQRDGKWIARIACREALLECDGNTGDERGPRVPLEVEGRCQAVFSADGRTLAVMSDGPALRVYDEVGQCRASIPVETRERVWDGEMNDQEHQMLALDPTGARVAACPFDGRIRVWSVSTGREIASLPAASKPDHVIFLGEDRLAHGDGLGGIHVHDLRGGHPPQRLSRRDPAEWWCPDPEGGSLATGLGEAWRVVDTDRGGVAAESEGGTPAPVRFLARRGDRLFVGGRSGVGLRALLDPMSRSVVLAVRTGQIAAEIEGSLLDVDRSGTRVLVVHQGEYRVVDLPGRAVRLRVPFDPDRADGDPRADGWPVGALSPDGGRAFLARAGGGCDVFEVDEGRILVGILRDGSERIETLRATPSGEQLLVVRDEGSLSSGMIVDLESRAIRTLPAGVSGWGSIAVAGDSSSAVWPGTRGAVLVALDSDRTISLGMGLPPWVREPGASSMIAAAYASGGRWLAYIEPRDPNPLPFEAASSILSVWDLSTERVHGRFAVGPNASAIDWSDDGTCIFVGHGDGSISKVRVRP